ncbi:MAG: LanC-like protein [Byssovorax sp.]
MLHDLQRHEPLSDASWDPDVARAAIAAITAEAIATFSPEHLWPTHPLDDEGEAAPLPMMYCGAAGVIFALARLARAGILAALHDFRSHLDDLERRNLALAPSWGHGADGLLMGRAGQLLLQHRLSPSPAVEDALAASIAANAQSPALDLIWGIPGTMHVALDVHERTSDARFAALFRAGAQTLAAALVQVEAPPCRMWAEVTGSARRFYVGAAHGFAGPASAIVRGLGLLPPDEQAAWTDLIVTTLGATALHDGLSVNWPGEVAPPKGLPEKKLIQWCHGAPGVITSIGALPDRRLDALLTAAGEAVWAAGPLRKGAGLCHGTAGNGYALLMLHQRTGEPRWLDRARAFAMHAIAQIGAERARHGRGRISLYTGDLGVALYLADCLTGRPVWPLLAPEIVQQVND